MAVAKALQLTVVSLSACGRLLGHARLSSSSHCSPPVPLTLLNVKSSHFKTDQKPKMVLTMTPSSRFLNRCLQTNGRLHDDWFCLYIQSMDLIQPQKSKHKVKKKSKLAVALLRNKLARSTPLSSILGGATDLTFHLCIQSMDLTLVHNLMEWGYQWKSVGVKLRVALQTCNMYSVL